MQFTKRLLAGYWYKRQIPNPETQTRTQTHAVQTKAQEKTLVTNSFEALPPC